MRAPKLPGHSDDVSKGSCLSCYYDSKGHECDCQSDSEVEEDLAPLESMATLFDRPLKNDRQRRQSEAAEESSDPPGSQDNTFQEDQAERVSADGEDSQDAIHRLQDMAINFARRARTLPSEEQQAKLEGLESLLGMDSFDFDLWDMVRCVFELPVQDRVKTAEMIMQILRLMLRSESLA